MENLLLKYMQNRFPGAPEGKSGGPYPFITISREFGCPSKVIARMLAEQLNKRQAKPKSPKWITINKEIVEESARQLELQPANLRHIFGAEEKGIMDDVLASFSSNYKSNLRIKKTIQEVIRSVAEKGYAIIVGRGGVAITHGYPLSLHIRLQAPLEWRLAEVATRHSMTLEAARKMIVETDKKRTALIEIFGHVYDNSLFDIIFNCKTIGKEAIVNSVLHLMEEKGML